RRRTGGHRGRRPPEGVGRTHLRAAPGRARRADLLRRRGSPGVTRPEDVALFIDAPTHHFDEDRLFALESPRNRDDCLLPHARVREVVAAKGVAVHTADYLLRGEDVRSCNLYVSIGRRRDWAALRQRPGVRLSAFFVTEPPVVDPAVYRALPEIAGSFRRLFTPAPAAALLPHVGTALRCEPFRLPALYDRPDPEA